MYRCLSTMERSVKLHNMYRRLSTMWRSVKLKAGCCGVRSRSFSGRSSRVTSLSPSSSVRESLDQVTLLPPASFVPESIDRVTSLPPFSSVGESLENSWTELNPKDLLVDLQNVIKKQKALEKKSKQTKTSAESQNKNLISNFIKGNIGLFSEMCEKTGNACNQNVTRVKSFSHASAELRHVFTSVLQDVGNLHWMGIGLLMLAFCIDRWSKAQSNKNDCWDVLEKLASLATHTIDVIDILKEEKIKHVTHLISEYASECLQQIHGSWKMRILYASTQESRIKRLDTEIHHLSVDLSLSVATRGLAARGNTTFTEEHDDMVGLRERVDGIVKLLEEGNSSEKEVRSIVLCGMLGVGSSTLGEAVFAALGKGRFECQTSCRVLMEQFSGFRDDQIQSHIVETLSKENRLFANHKDGQKGLTNCFKNLKKPVQIFIDGVADEEQLRCLLPDNMGKDLPEGSRLLVTTFNERVYGFMKMEKGFESCQLYEVKQLKCEEARELFCRKAFRKPKVPEEFNYLKLRNEIDELLTICGGLPLALELVGKYVGSSKPKREDILCRVKHAVKTLSAGDPLTGTKNDRLATMKFAYDQLGSPLQSDFLDISVIYVGRSWKEAELQFGENLRTLKEFSLLKKESLVHGDGNHAVVAMDSLLIALGQKQGHADHQGARVVAKNKDTVADCPRGVNGLKQLELLQLDHCTENPVDSFEETEKLRHLELYGMIVKRCSRFPSHLQSLRFRCPKSPLPFPVEKLSLMDELLLLKLSSNPLVDEDLQIFKMPAGLKMMKLTDSKTLKEIQRGRNSSMEQLTLYNCPQLRKIGQLSPTISKLFIRGSPEVEDFSGIGDLHDLKELSLIDCGLKTDKIRLPSNLRILVLKGSPQVKDLSRVGDLHALEELSLINCGLKTENFRLPSNLHSLDLSDNPNLVRLPNFSHFKLKNITLRNCSSLVQVSESLFPLLRRSDILGCSSLKDLPSRLKISRPQSPRSSAGHQTWTWVRTRVRDHVCPLALHQFRKCISDRIFRSKEENDARERERLESKDFSSQSARECGTRSSSVSAESSFTSLADLSSVSAESSFTSLADLSSVRPSRASLRSLVPVHVDFKIDSFIRSYLSAPNRPTAA